MRFPVQVDDDKHPLVLLRANSQNRSLSNYAENLIYADLEAAGLVKGNAKDQTELLSVIAAALTADPSIAPKLTAICAVAARNRRTGKAAA